jgi:hypothetical protein
MVLELNDVRVGNGVGIDGAQQGSGVMMYGADVERASLGDGGERERDDATHVDRVLRSDGVDDEDK